VSFKYDSAEQYFTTSISFRSLIGLNIKLRNPNFIHFDYSSMPTVKMVTTLNIKPLISNSPAHILVPSLVSLFHK